MADILSAFTDNVRNIRANRILRAIDNPGANASGRGEGLSFNLIGTDCRPGCSCPIPKIATLDTGPHKPGAQVLTLRYSVCFGSFVFWNGPYQRHSSEVSCTQAMTGFSLAPATSCHCDNDYVAWATRICPKTLAMGFQTRREIESSVPTGQEDRRTALQSTF